MVTPCSVTSTSPSLRSELRWVASASSSAACEIVPRVTSSRPSGCHGAGGSEASRVETVTVGQLDSVLLRERARELGARERSSGDEHLAEPASGCALLGQRVLEVGRNDQAPLDQELAEEP